MVVNLTGAHPNPTRRDLEQEARKILSLVFWLLNHSCIFPGFMVSCSNFDFLKNGRDSSRGMVCLARAPARVAADLRPQSSASQSQRQELNMEIEIKRNGSQPSGKGSADWFTGS